jgi:Tol biopolymer transport system component
MRMKSSILIIWLFLFWISLTPAETFHIEVNEDYVVRRMGPVVMYGELATSDAFPFGFDHIYSFNADSSFVAFIGVRDDTFELIVLSNGNEPAISGIGEGAIDGRTSLHWSPDGTMLAFTRGQRVWSYDAEADSAWKLSEPEEIWMEDYDPSFSDDGAKVIFFRGSRFEYVFSGDKYSINLDGTGLRKEEEEVPTYPPEDLRGTE